MVRLCFCLLLQTLYSVLMPLAWSICTIFNLLSSPFLVSTGFSHSSSQGYLLDLSVFSVRRSCCYICNQWNMNTSTTWTLRSYKYKLREDIRLTFPDVFWGNIEIPRPLLTLFCKNCEIKNILGKCQIRFLSKGLYNTCAFTKKIPKSCTKITIIMISHLGPLYAVL